MPSLNALTENEALVKLCPFGAGFSPVRETCAVSRCMAWRRSFETEDLPTGVDPQTAGWSKKGPPYGVGGAVTYRQRWEREVGRCGHVFSD